MRMFDKPPYFLTSEVLLQLAKDSLRQGDQVGADSGIFPFRQFCSINFPDKN